MNGTSGRRAALGGAAVLLALLAVLPTEAAAADPVPSNPGAGADLVPGMSQNPDQSAQSDAPDRGLSSEAGDANAPEGAQGSPDAADGQTG